MKFPIPYLLQERENAPGVLFAGYTDKVYMKVDKNEVAKVLPRYYVSNIEERLDGALCHHEMSTSKVRLADVLEILDYLGIGYEITRYNDWQDPKLMADRFTMYALSERPDIAKERNFLIRITFPIALAKRHGILHREMGWGRMSEASAISDMLLSLHNLGILSEVFPTPNQYNP